MAGDLDAALAFAADDDPQTALRIAAALATWWRYRGREATGRQWLRRLLHDPRTADADPQVRAGAEKGLMQLRLPTSADGRRFRCPPRRPSGCANRHAARTVAPP
jgi:ketosteroid isomerase-like protein